MTRDVSVAGALLHAQVWNVTPLNAIIDDLKKSEIRRHVTHASTFN